MAVKMRLRREGKRKQPFYRVVVADARSPRDGRFIEDIGYYQPLREPSEIAIDRDRALYWLGQGVQPSDAVRQLLRVTGIWADFNPGDPGRQRVTATPAPVAPSMPAAPPADTPAAPAAATDAATEDAEVAAEPGSAATEDAQGAAEPGSASTDDAGDEPNA